MYVYIELEGAPGEGKTTAIKKVKEFLSKEYDLREVSTGSGLGNEFEYWEILVKKASQ